MTKLFVGITIGLLLILGAVTYALTTIDTGADGARDLAVQLAELRHDAVPKANARNEALCGIARILIKERKEGQRASIKQFLEPLRRVDPERFDALRAKSERRTDTLAHYRKRLDCTPIPIGPSP